MDESIIIANVKPFSPLFYPPMNLCPLPLLPHRLREFDSEEDENIYRVLYKSKEMTVWELYTVSEVVLLIVEERGKCIIQL